MSSSRTQSAAEFHANCAWLNHARYDGFGNLFQKGGTGLAASYNADWSSQLNSSKNQVGSHSTDGTLIYSHGIWLYDYAHNKKRVTRAELNGRRFVDFYSGNERIGTYELVQRNDNGTITFETVTRKTELYLGGKRVASEDRLGSAADVRLAPYGEELGTPTANDRVKFATYYRDDTGMDYADQRYYRPGYGRFASTDPYEGSAKASQPGSWNRYAYVEGDPANANDPSGLDTITCILPASGQAGGQSFCYTTYDSGATFTTTVTAPAPQEPRPMYNQSETQGILDGLRLPDLGTGAPAGGIPPGPIVGAGGAFLPPVTPDDPCGGIAESIDGLVNAVRDAGTNAFKGLRQRIRQMRNMRRSHPAWEGHATQIRNQQTTLQNLLDSWNNSDCGDPPSGVRELVDMQILSYEDMRAIRAATDNTLRFGMAASGVYLGYRLIRLLPSLFPPMWWTIPGNVAIP